jgi:signal transduction histidine kinase
MTVWRQLFAGYLALLTVAVVGLTVPLAWLTATAGASALAAGRGPEAARLATEVVGLLRTNANQDPAVAELSARLARYAGETGARAIVVSVDGDLVARSDPALAATDPAVASAVAAARNGRAVRDPGAAWPWRTEPLIVVEPVLDGDRVVGAVATLSPVDGVRAATLRHWLLLSVVDAALLALGVSVLRAVPRRILRPVARLERAAREWRHGSSTTPVEVGPAPRELRQLADSFNDLAARIDALLTRQRTFASYASHQLRTPLGILRLSVETLRPAADDEAAIADYADVLAELDRMAVLCESLLAYASAESVAADITDVDVSELADRRVERWRSAATQAGVTIERRGMPGVVARAAHQAVGQCLDVFLDNAVKYAGRGAHVVVATYSLPGGRTQLDVIDDGPGISAADPGQAAEAFWRAKAHAGLEGSGLGVTIAEALVTASGGRLSLLPVRPRGLRIRILLPAAATGLPRATGSIVPGRRGS